MLVPKLLMALQKRRNQCKRTISFRLFSNSYMKEVCTSHIMMAKRRKNGSKGYEKRVLESTCFQMNVKIRHVYLSTCVKPLHIHVSTTQKHYYSSFLKSTAYFSLFFCFELPWVPDDIFFHLIDTDRSRTRSAERKTYPSREPYQTVSTVYFIYILGILKTELRSQGSFE